jgi:hypothetical protein
MLIIRSVQASTKPVSRMHKPGERDEFDARAAQRSIRRGGERQAIRLDNGLVWDSGCGGARQPRRVGAIADDADDLGWAGSVCRSIDQRLQI